ncbi:hypothetical protein POX_e06419 [Penicillium oxalicum]|uniref:hypothetical protein n=1 Tax=Penicillium oxalicum TaxID=69781 RepID=UPI0020B84449|nr:hypothetical protein POX_e06419 [Penicillium oxalicum]KAI2788403.1 hypothetical protein POX_e06419 [Penicillium oxalicum]
MVPQGFDPGAIISLDKPAPSRWELLEKVNEHDYQVTKEEHDDNGSRSFATARYLCCDPKTRSRKAFMRIYMQVPHRKTEMDDADTRSQQATMYHPRELIAYLDLTEKGSTETPRLLGYKIDKQDRSGLVPGGFMIWLVHEREQVRLAFLETISKLHKNGWGPRVGGAHCLIWHREAQKLYVIGPFGKAGKLERPIHFDAKWIAHFELAKPEPSTNVFDSDWDGDTSRWQW